MGLPQNPHVKLHDAPPVWHIVSEGAELAAAIPPAMLQALDSGLPVARRHAPGASGQFVRPPGHRRAFYVELPGAGCLAVKGSEVQCDDFPALVASIDASRVWVECATGTMARPVLEAGAELHGIEKWPLLEAKVPGAVTLSEALAEARAALAVQRAHLARYGAPARLPLPIAVYRHPDDAVARALDALRPRLGPRAREHVELLASRGLAAYVYHYPVVPIRVVSLHAAEVNLGMVPGALARRLAALGARVDVAQTVGRWMKLLARMLALGFLPAEPGAVVAGSCLQVQNAVVDGGFADLGSVYPLAAARDEREVRDALRRAVAELGETILRLHLGGLAPTGRLRERLVNLHVVVHQGLAAHLRAESQPIDDRIASVFLPPPGRSPGEEIARILLALDGVKSRS